MIEPGANSGLRYTRVAAVLHWSIAVLLLLVTGLALFRETFAPFATVMIGLHKVLGWAILVLALARLAWRLAHRPPRVSDAVGRLEHKVANGVHWLLYFLMIAVPLSGWIFVSYAPDSRPFDFRGPDTVPELPVTQDDEAGLLWHEVHELAGFLFIGLLFLHVAGVVRHQIFKRSNIVGRMSLRDSGAPNWLARATVALAMLWLVGLSLDFFGVRFWG